MFKRSDANGLQYNPKKAQLGPQEEHVVSAQCVHADPKMVETVTQYSALTIVTELQRFLGLAGFCRRFIENFVELVFPLTELLKSKLTALRSICSIFGLTPRRLITGHTKSSSASRYNEQ